MNSQKIETDQVATAMHEMTATAHEVANLASRTAEGAQSSLQALQQARLLRAEYGAVVIEDLDGLRRYGM